MSEPLPLEALAQAVRAAFGAGVRIVAAEPLAGDASTRRYVRLRLAGTAEPATTVAMLLGADPLPLGSEEIGRLGAAGGWARWDPGLSVEPGVEPRHARRLPAGERAELLAALAPLAEPFERATPVLAHRDFHAWNLHVQNGRLRILDFQDALLAPDAYDLASLLTDRTTAELIPPALEASLIERFVHGRAEAGVPVEAGFAERYRRCALQRALKVIGRFYFLERVKGKPGYLAYLPAVYGVARRMLRAEPALATAAARLVAWVPELGEERPA